MEEDIEELKRLLYRDELSQYGKRKLLNYYEQQEKDYKRALEMNEVLLKENKKLNEAIKWYFEHTTGEICTPEILDKILRNDYISKQTIKNKIKEYKDILKDCNKVKDIDRIRAINERILALEELI